MRWEYKNIDENKAVELAIENGITENTAKILLAKGYDTKEKISYFVNAGLKDFVSPSALHGVDKAANIIINRIKEGKKIRVIGDYDVDGITSTSIIIKGLRACNANIDYDIPERKRDGYGLNTRLIDEAIKDRVDLIITVDNGIAAFEPILKAREAGIEVIVTDHHEVGYDEDDKGKKTYKYPDANIIIDPKDPAYDFKFRDICGAMVALKLITRVFSLTGKRPKDIEELIELAALGTVCDVMELTHENRGLVKAGIKKMNNSKNIGLRALIKEYDLTDKEISCYHLGFVLGPAINASGRIGSPKTGVELLLSETEEEAENHAKELKELNERRKKITETGVEDAIKYIESHSYHNDDVIIAYIPKTDESVAGIIAGRIREKYNHPVFVLTDSESEGIIKGSGRSIEKFDMFEHLNKVSEVLSKFGGHSLAAGLSLRKDNLELFRSKINENTGLKAEDFEIKVTIDALVPLHLITERFIDELKMFEPFGKGNEKPIIADKKVSIKKITVVGSERKILKFDLKSNRNKSMKGIFFGDIDDFNKFLVTNFGEEEKKKAYLGEPNKCVIDVIFVPEINEWQNLRSIEIVVNNFICA